MLKKLALITFISAVFAANYIKCVNVVSCDVISIEFGL